jgi:hypothetical protein
MFDAVLTAHRYRWSHTDELLAQVLEAVDRLGILFVQAWGDKRASRAAQKQRPFRYPRPVDGRPKKHRPATNAEISRFFGVPLRHAADEGMSMTEGGE